jgi:CysZ protein
VTELEKPTQRELALAPTGRDASLAASRPGVLAGARALFQGIGFLISTPTIWPLALVPVGIASALTISLAWAAVHFGYPLVASVIGAHDGVLGILATIAEVAAMAIAVLLALVLGIALAQPLSSPALAALVRRQRAALGAPPPPEVGLATDVARSIQSLLVGAAFGVPILALLFIVGTVFPAAVVITLPLKIIVSALLLAWDLCDYPLSIAGVPIGARIRLVRRHLGAMVGFGFALALVAFIPCGLLLVLPAGVVGATRLTLAIESESKTEP